MPRHRRRGYCDRREAERDPDGTKRAARYNASLLTLTRHPGDRTDFRNLPAVAPGGPVERIFPNGGAMPEPATPNLPKQETTPMPEPRIVPPTEAQKPAIARLLLDLADRRGWVGVTPPDIAAKTGLPVMDVTHAIWDFQKQGMMKFREAKVGEQSTLISLRLTTQGRAAMTAMVTKPKAAPEPDDAGLERLAQSMARTMTDPDYEPLPEPVAEQVLALAFVPEPADYPLIAALRQRKAALEQAAALLEQAGQDDMAIAAMDKANSADLYSPLEAEAVRLWEKLARE